MALPSDAAHGCRHVSRSGGGMKTTNNPLRILAMNSQLKKKLLAAAIATVAAMPVFAYAQAHADHAGHAPVPATAHGMSAMDHGSGEMDHGDMQMQGGSAPPEDRKSVVKEKVLKMLYSVSLRGKR